MNIEKYVHVLNADYLRALPLPGQCHELIKGPQTTPVDSNEPTLYARGQIRVTMTFKPVGEMEAP